MTKLLLSRFKMTLLCTLGLSLLVLTSCADGKFAWDLEGEKKQDNPTANNSAPQIPEHWTLASKKFNENSMKMGEIYKAWSWCFSGARQRTDQAPADALVSKYLPAYSEGDVESHFSWQRLQEKEMNLLSFDFSYSNKKELTERASSEPPVKVQFRNIPSPSSNNGKLQIDISKGNQANFLLSTSGFPSLVFRESLSPVQMDEVGNVINEEEQNVRGVAVVVPKDHKNLINFRILNSPSSQTEVSYQMNTEWFKGCLEDVLKLN